MVELGTKIIGNFGAMIPLWEGEVVTVAAFDENFHERNGRRHSRSNGG